MRRWAPFAAIICGAVLTGLAPIWIINHRIDEIRNERTMPETDHATTTVPCPKTGLSVDVTTVQKTGETDPAFAARHAAKVQAFIDDCAQVGTGGGG